MHPSVQARNYHQYLSDMHPAFYEGDAPIHLDSCSYLHNLTYDLASPLYAAKFTNLLRDHPMFVKQQAAEFATYLVDRVGGSGGVDLLSRIDPTRSRPSRKLLEHVASVIKGKSDYTLLDEQIVAYNKILFEARKGFQAPEKSVVIIEGGPGTGKSLIAINVMATLAELGYNTQHATGSKAFTENLRKAVGTRAGAVFKYFNSFSTAEHNLVDVILCDEAHRIRTTSNNRYTRRDQRSAREQVDELIEVSKVAVFFIDDRQVVRPEEIGSSELIRSAASRYGARLVEERLHTQFRCAGSAAFVSWIDGVLQLPNAPESVFEPSDAFEFKIVDTVEELDSSIREKVIIGQSARIVAGFCWPWSDPLPNGTLVDDVVIGSFKRPWNAKPEAGRLAKGIPKAAYWSTDAGGAEQIGCVYTAQGFEFDYVGVIVGRDLSFDVTSGRWKGNSSESRDSALTRRAKEKFTDYARNVYRVLLTRGMRGCLVYFQDRSARERFQSLLSKGER